MPAPRVRAVYDQLGQVARNFGDQAQQEQQSLSQLRLQMEGLQNGDWLGTGATAFYAEMNQTVLPTLNRLVKALQAAQQVTQQISREMKTAEDNAAACFRLTGAAGEKARGSGSASGFAGAAASASGTANVSRGLFDRALDAVGGGLGVIGLGPGGMLLDAVGRRLGIGDFGSDLVRGVIDEGSDMLSGLWHLATNNPIDTVKGLAYAVTHPGELWDALKKPYVEAWESGHPGRAIGRGILAIGSFFIGAGEAGAAGKAAGVAGRAGELADAAGVAGRLGEAGRAAEVARAGELAEAARAAEVAEAARAASVADEAATVSRGARAADEAGELAGGARAAEEAVPVQRIPPQPDPPVRPDVIQPKPPAWEDDLLSQDEINVTRRPGGAPQPRRAEVGNFADRWAEQLPDFLDDSGMIDLPPGLQRQVEIPHPSYSPGYRPRMDRLDREAGEIIEIKPIGRLREGEVQARQYAEWMDRFDPLPNGQPWRYRVVTYDIDTVERYLVSIGYLE